MPWVTVLGATVSISSCVASGRAPKGTEPRCHRPHSRLGGRWLCWSVGAGQGVALAASAPGHRPSPWLQEGQGRTCTPLNVPSHVWLFVVSQNSRLGDTENTDSDHDAGRPTVRGGETRAAPPPRRRDAGPPRPHAVQVPLRTLETLVIYNLRRINVILKEKNVQSHVSTCSQALTSRCTHGCTW